MYGSASNTDPTRPLELPAEPSPYPAQPYPAQPYPVQPDQDQAYQPQPYLDQAYPQPPQSRQPYSAQPYSAQPYAQQAYPQQQAAVVMVPVGLNVDPMTGAQLSDKSKIVAGLLQLLLGFFFALGGVGRLYAGHTALGVIQLVASVVAWTMFWCGFLLLFPFFVYGGIWLWFVIDGIVLMAGRPVDGQGRLLRS